MKAGLIGRGRWGKILIPYIEKYFNLVAVEGKDYFIQDCDVVFIATPIETHYEVVKACLRSGKHVFVEKPLSTTSKQCKELIRIAKQNRLYLYTDYLEMTAPSRQFMLKKVHEIGKIQNITAITLNPVASDFLWQLVVHQLSILSLFIDLKKASFQKVKNGIVSKNIMLYCANGQRFKDFTIIGDNGILRYDQSFGVELFTDGHYQYKFDENNNIDYSIREFLQVLKGKPSNSQTALQITRIIESL